MSSLFAVLALCLAQSAEPRDRAAVEAYRRGDLEAARSLWLASLEEGLPEYGERGESVPAAERGRILYDLGNAAFRSGDVLEAVGWYTASLRLRPRDRDAWSNLEHARTTAKLEPADRGDLAATAWRLLSALTPAESEWLALFGAAVWGAILAAEALRGGRLLRRLALVGGLFALGSLAPLAWHRANEGSDALLVIEASEGGAEVHSEPRTDAVVIGLAPTGEQVEREDELPGWVKVETSAGVVGWIDTRAAFVLDR